MSSSRTHLDYLSDILEAISDLNYFVAGMNFETFSSDKKTVNAVIRSLEVIGEAVKKLPISVRDEYPDIPWAEIAGMRDKLIHEYFGVDIEIVWETVKGDLSGLKDAVMTLLKED